MVIAHELGHQLDLQHSQNIQPNGTLIEYGDDSCIMGGGFDFSVGFNPLHLVQLGLMPLGKIEQLDEIGETRHILDNAEQSGTKQLRQIAVPGSDKVIYVAYRQPLGLDQDDQLMQSLWPGFSSGAMIYYWPGGSAKMQLATTHDGSLLDGGSYSTPDGKVVITQISHDSSAVTVDVKIDPYASPVGWPHRGL